MLVTMIYVQKQINVTIQSCNPQHWNKSLMWIHLQTFSVSSAEGIKYDHIYMQGNITQNVIDYRLLRFISATTEYKKYPTTLSQQHYRYLTLMFCSKCILYCLTEQISLTAEITTRFAYLTHKHRVRQVVRITETMLVTMLVTMIYVQKQMNVRIHKLV